MSKHEDGDVIPNVWCIGDANGKMMLAHAASAQGISAIENIVGRPHVVNHDAVPAACFTHPEISMVGPTEEQSSIISSKFWSSKGNCSIDKFYYKMYWSRSRL